MLPRRAVSAAVALDLVLVVLAGVLKIRMVGHHPPCNDEQSSFVPDIMGPRLRYGQVVPAYPFKVWRDRRRIESGAC